MRSAMRHLTLAALTLTLTTTPGRAISNLLVNSSFDGGTLSPWAAFGGGVWDSKDAGNVTGSGSARLPVFIPAWPIVALPAVKLESACLTIQPAADYELSADVAWQASLAAGMAPGLRVDIVWYDDIACQSAVGRYESPWVSWGTAWQRLHETVIPGGAFARVRVVTSGGEGVLGGSFDTSVYVDNLTLVDTRCADSTVLCLQNNRFVITANWRSHTAQGQGRALQLGNETGVFTFFGPGNIEVLVKVLDACSSYGKYWVFTAGLTNLEVELQVSERFTLGPTGWTYRNSLGQPYATVLDTVVGMPCP